MKTLNLKNHFSKILLGTLTVLSLAVTACGKKGGSNNNNGYVTPTCYTAGCIPGVGGVGGGELLYGGMTNGSFAQAQFQVYGTSYGTGYGSITGTVQFAGNYVCQVGPSGNLYGPYQIQMTQPGQVTADVFQGNVMLTGPTGAIPAMIKIVPSTYQGAGLFSLYMYNCAVPLMEMNF